MTIEYVSAAEWRTRLRNAILSRDQEQEVTYGPIRDVVVEPVAAVMEQAHSRIRTVSELVSLLNTGSFTDDDADQFVANEAITRWEDDGYATVTLTFSAGLVDPAGSNLVVQRGFPVATQVDASTGAAVTFVTSETRTLVAASASSYYNLTTGRYELNVPAVAVQGGSTGVVARGRINRPLRALNGFDSVTNASASTGGRPRETTPALLERYKLAIRGRDLTTPTGIKKWALDTYANVTDVHVVYGDDALLTRTASDAGAVDAYIIGTESTTATETHTFLGVNQLIALDNPPIEAITSVTVGATTYTEDVDFEVTYDTSGNASSTRAIEGITFLPDDGVAPTPPTAGAVVSIEYTYNNQIRTLQTASEADTAHVFGRDLLWKAGTEVPIYLDANLRVTTGYSTSTVQALVETALTDFVGALLLGDDVEESDLQGEVRRLTGVDNLVITRLVRTSTSTGVADISIANNEYARLDAANLTVTLF